MHKPETDLEIKICKILWDFEIITDNLMPHRRSDQEIIYLKQTRDLTV